MKKEKRVPEEPKSMREIQEKRYDRLRVLDKNGDVSGAGKKAPYVDVDSRIPQVPNPRRAQEENDGRILFEDHNAVGDMPVEGFQREFNKYHPERMFGED